MNPKDLAGLKLTAEQTAELIKRLTLLDIIPQLKDGQRIRNLSFKTAPGLSFVKAEGDTALKGLYSIFGNRDSYGDVMEKGSFLKTQKEGRKRIKFLWNHDGWQPPIATIKELYEVDASDLPPEVFEVAPKATGGAVVVREYYKNVPFSMHVREGVLAGDINEMSFAYDIPTGGSRWVEEIIGGEKVQTQYISEVIQFDASDVNWGANSATVAMRGVPAEALAVTFKSLIQEVKGGKRPHLKDQALFPGIVELAHELAALLVKSEPPPAQPPAVPPAEGSEKAAGILREADAMLAKYRLLTLQTEA